MTIGSELRQAREEKGISLRELAERTKVRPPMLRAIEADELERLPGGVITRGFLKLYAREVGLDPDEIGRRYTAYLESTEADGLTRGAAPDEHQPAGAVAAAIATPWFARAGVVGAGVVVALLAVGYLAWRPLTGTGSDSQGPRPRTGEVVADPAASPPADPRTDPGSAAQAAPARPPASALGAPSEEGLRVDLHATAPCWVSAMADGEQVAYRLMNTGERQTIRVMKEAVLRIGIPANLAVSINDQPVRPFARPGMPVTLRITPANYRDLVVR